MKVEKREIYVCEGCGGIHLREEEINHHNGVEFCNSCSDRYLFYYDPTYGVIMLPKENVFMLDSY